jgi:heptosyltransferase-2/heptosyltransferase-3
MLPLLARTARADNRDRDDTILIFQPDHLGDILFSQPAARRIRAANPSSRLVAVVGPWSTSIARMAWPVDDVVEVEFPGFTRARHGGLLDPYKYLRDAAKQLAHLRPRAAVVLRPDAWWAAWLAALVAPEVVASDDRRVVHFASASVSVAPDVHAAVRAWQIASGLTGDIQPPDFQQFPLSIPVNCEAAASVKQLLERHQPGRYVVIHPGSGAAVKEWAPYRWNALARRLQDAGCTVVLTGSAAERALCETVARGVAGAVVTAGETSVEELAELLRGAQLVLGPDCGPLHLAVAVETPSIHLFGPSYPGRYGPWGSSKRHIVITAGWSCPHCGDLSSERPAMCGCMLAIPVDAVWSAVLTQLSSHARN